MGDRTLPSLDHCSLQQISHPATTANRCRQNQFNKGEKNEIQIVLLRRRAAMTRAVLPNPSARAEWLLPGLTDRTLNHWARAPPLDGGDGNDDADTGTDSAIPDADEDDFASLTSEQSTSLQHSSPVLPARPPGAARFLFDVSGRRSWCILWSHCRLPRPRAGKLLAVCLGCRVSFSSDEHHRSHSCLGTGIRFGIQKQLCHYGASLNIRIRDTFGVCVFASATFLVCSLVKRSLYPCTDYFVNDSETGDPQLATEPRVGRNHGWAMRKS